MANYKKALGALTEALEAAPNKKQAARLLELKKTDPASKEIEDILSGNWNPPPLPVKVATDIPAPLPRAKPRSKDEMLEIVHRVGPQLKGEFVRSQKKGKSESVAGKSKKRYEHEATLSHDISAEDQQLLPVLDIADRLGSVDVSLAGDASRLGVLSGVGGLKFKRPVQLQAGPLFDEGWASGADTSLDYWKMLDRIQKQYGGAPVNAVFSNMGAEGLNYAVHYADSLLEALNSSKIPKKNLDALDQMMRNAYPEFVGVRNQDEAILQMMVDPKLRKHFSFLMEQVDVGKNLGLPRGYDVKHAVEEPMLRTTEPALAGFVVKKPKLGLTHLPIEEEHNTYGLTMPMDTMGRQRVLYPREVQFPDMLEAIRKNPKQAPNEVGSLHYSVGRQIIDPQQVDQVKMFEDLMKQEYGLRKGGAVHMAGGGDAAKAKKLMDIASGAKKVGTVSKADAALAKHMEDLLHASEEMNQARARLPMGTDAAKAKIEREFAEEAARKAALNAGHTFPTETGKQALAKAKQTLTKQPPVLKVKPPSDNILNVRQSNFNHSRPIGNETVNIDELSGGVRLSDPSERKRVDELASKISSPDGYISRIIVDQDNNVIEGQHRLEALRQLGVQDVPVYKIEDLEASMPVDKMRDAMNEVGAIHPDYVHQLLGHALDHISEAGIDEARKMNYGKYQQYYDAALNAIQSKAHGGAVHMANGGQPRKYVPPSQLFPINKTIGEEQNKTSALQNIANAAKDESTTFGDKGATMDIINRGPVADILGGLPDLANLPLQGLDYLASQIPAFSKPASVMEPEGERVPIARVSSDEPFGGSDAWRKQFQKSGVTSMTERPLTEMAVSLASPLAPFAASKALKAGKALAPAAGKLAQEFAEQTQFGMPLQMNVVPPAEGVAQAAGKAAEVKAPANDLGFYSTVEKAALNLQRKSGNGDAFLSDLMKNQGVSQAKLDETGLTAALKGRKGVTRDEVQKLAAEGKIPLKERVVKEFDEDEQSVQNHREKIERLNDKTIYYGRSIDNLNADLKKSIDMYGADNAYASQIRDKIKLMEEAYQQTYDELNRLNRVDLQEGSAKYGPKTSPSYNTEGGENYREILIKTPENVAKPADTSKWKVVTEDENKYSGQRVIKIYDENGNFVSERTGYRGSDYDAINNAAKQRQKYEASEMNFEGSHHSDPNILMHLRVADHVDVEGKKGLLVDELQSDWHQQGRDKGYRTKLSNMPQMSADELFDKHFADLTSSQRDHLRDFMKKWESAEYNGKQSELDKLANEYQNWVSKQTIFKGPPDAPFKDDWYQLGLKRAIKEATDSGMDRVYLTTGKTQADRYDLSKHVNDLGYKPDGKGSGRLQAFDKDRITVLDENIPEEKLAEYIGKDAAKKLLESEKVMGTHSLSNADLQVGGEGMKQYYDKTYLNYLKKYAKQHGATVGETRLPVGGKRDFMALSTEEVYKYRNDPEFMKYFSEASNGKDYNSLNDKEFMNAWTKALSRVNGQKVYYIDLNPKLKNTAKKGQAFADGGAVQSPNGFDYESHVNKLMDTHNLGSFDYEGHLNKIMGMAEGGAAYNTSPDMSDGGAFIQAPSFKIGGPIPRLTR
jgi:hypothetical protein